jgi:hypothetical protein
VSWPFAFVLAVIVICIAAICIFGDDDSGLRRIRARKATFTGTVTGEGVVPVGALLSTHDGILYRITSVKGSQIEATRVSWLRRLWWRVCELARQALNAIRSVVFNG